MIDATRRERVHAKGLARLAAYICIGARSTCLPHCHCPQAWGGGVPSYNDTCNVLKWLCQCVAGLLPVWQVS